MAIPGLLRAALHTTWLRSPQSTWRFVAAGLMFCGIGVLGVVTATFASWLVERVEQIDDLEEGVAATADDVQALREEIVRLRESLLEQQEPA